MQISKTRLILGKLPRALGKQRLFCKADKAKFWPFCLNLGRFSEEAPLISTSSINHYVPAAPGVQDLQPCQVCDLGTRSLKIFVPQKSKPKMTTFEEFLSFLMASAKIGLPFAKNDNMTRCPIAHWRWVPHVRAVEQKTSRDKRTQNVQSRN